MTVKAIIRAADWTLGADTEEGAPQAPLHEVECTTCEESSGCFTGERLSVEIWALKHTGLNPTHRSFRAVQTSFWRATPAPTNPMRERQG
ncbi:hypothetical protein [Streptomyces sp. ISL-100]|uniref:DUF7848 domain-containing protein n=1 Tax=Streptomyces sp. ISL-100 TaxID=2819173 RepID=UPI001BE678FE|nr:hypothetical protein [Streptomyces sp. ISL-100]MBT2401466.1 hypothetical protein [Streptomyces sp. ISL-100]